jgi:chaperonin GroES
MKLRPLNDRIIVKRMEEETRTASGIIIPDTAKEKPIQGSVVAVGPGKTKEDGTKVKPTSKRANWFSSANTPETT